MMITDAHRAPITPRLEATWSASPEAALRMPGSRSSLKIFLTRRAARSTALDVTPGRTQIAVVGTPAISRLSESMPTKVDFPAPSTPDTATTTLGRSSVPTGAHALSESVPSRSTGHRRDHHSSASQNLQFLGALPVPRTHPPAPC